MKINCVSNFYAYLNWAYMHGIDYKMRVRESGRKVWETDEFVLGTEREEGYAVEPALFRGFNVWEANPEVQDWYFTYGGNHCTRDGRSLGYCFTVIKGTLQEARLAMVRERGDKWSFQYDSMGDAGIEQFGLSEINLRAVSLEKRDD